MHSWLQSVYSDGSPYYVSNPKPRSGETISIRLSVSENDELKAVILRSREFGSEILREMAVRDVRHGLRFYETQVTVREHLFAYQFYLVTESSVYYCTQHRVTDYMPDESRDFKILVDYTAPDWTKNAVFYQIFPDRFRNSRPDLDVKDGAYTYRGHPVRRITNWDTPAAPYEEAHCLDFYGGDLYGIIDSLDYLQSLGVSALYLNPIFWAPSAHRYDALDFDYVCPHLGGNEALAALTQALHERGMRLMLDISVNHVSSDAKWFNRDHVFFPPETGAYSNADAPERDFFFFDADNNYHRWAGVETMPTLNYASPALRRRIYGAPDAVLKKWLRPPFSIDAWRFDVADVMARSEHADVYREVWREINRELKAVNPAVILLAEEWTDSAYMLEGDAWDSVMNYFGFARPVREFLGEGDLFSVRNETLAEVKSSMTAVQLKARIEQFCAKMPHVVAGQLLNHLNTHDTPRLHNNPQVSRNALLGAITLMFTLPGMPCIYYGDEKLLDGRPDDVDGARYPMDWTDEGDLSQDKREQMVRYRRLAELKQTSDVLINGGFRIVYAKGRVLASARFTTQEMLLTVWSTEATNHQADINMAALGFAGFDDLTELFGLETDASIRGERLRVTVPPHGSYLLHLRRKVRADNEASV